MLRLVAYLFVAIILISVLRSVIGLIMRFLSHALRAETPREMNQRRHSIPLTGELKKDPVCGTYTTAATAVRETVRGETFYFCSTQCRDKFAAHA